LIVDDREGCWIKRYKKEWNAACEMEEKGIKGSGRRRGGTGREGWFMYDEWRVVGGLAD